jgi:hypothetical protein
MMITRNEKYPIFSIRWRVMKVLDSYLDDGLVVIWFGAGVAAFIAAVVVVSLLAAKERRAQKALAAPVAVETTPRVSDQWVETRPTAPSFAHADLGSSAAAH